MKESEVTGTFQEESKKEDGEGKREGIAHL